MFSNYPDEEDITLELSSSPPPRGAAPPPIPVVPQVARPPLPAPSSTHVSNENLQGFERPRRRRNRKRDLNSSPDSFEQTTLATPEPEELEIEEESQDEVLEEYQESNLAAFVRETVNFYQCFVFFSAGALASSLIFWVWLKLNPFYIPVVMASLGFFFSGAMAEQAMTQSWRRLVLTILALVGAILGAILVLT